ncbi:MAG TPA: DUF4411 family protein [Longimicrobium sp.]
MVYVFDCNSFLELQAYYPATFPTFWERFDGLVGEGRVVSVAEARKELEFLATAQHMVDWVAEHAWIFTPPSAAELRSVAEIFSVPHFRQLVGKRQIELGRPVADPFLVARARQLGACVVTEETHKPNAAKLPNVCGHFGVECVKLRGFLEREGWRF